MDALLLTSVPAATSWTMAPARLPEPSGGKGIFGSCSQKV